MKINPKLKTLFEQNSIDYDNAVNTLLALYHKLNVILSTEMINKLSVIKLIDKNYSTGGFDILINLYEGEAEITGWEWIEDYRNIFRKADPKKAGGKTSVKSKMKKFLIEHPDVKKDEILAAARLYVADFLHKDTTYLQQADYFISKLNRAQGSSDISSRLEQFLEVVRAENKKADGMSKEALRRMGLR